MERVRKAINIIGNLLAAVGFLGLFVSGGWQGEFFPGFFIMIGACMGLSCLAFSWLKLHPFARPGNTGA